MSKSDEHLARLVEQIQSLLGEVAVTLRERATEDVERAAPKSRAGPSTLADEMLMPKEAAVILKVHVNTLNKWRCTGEGPAYVRCGRAIRYLRSDIDAYIARQRDRT